MKKRITSSEKLLFHLNRINLPNITVELLPSPTSIIMDVTNRQCHQNCWYCYIAQYSSTRQLFDSNKELPFEKACKVITDMAENGVKSIEFCGAAEPLLYPKVYSLVEHILNSGIEFGLLTSGINLDSQLAFLLGTRAKWIRISFDSVNEDVYNIIRRPKTKAASFSSIRENIMNICRIKSENKSNTELGISTVIEPRNIDQIFSLAKFSKSCGMSYHRFCTVTFHSSEKLFKNVDWSIIDEQINRIKAELIDDNFFIIEPTNPFLTKSNYLSRNEGIPCYFSLLTMVIDCELRAYPCAETKWLEEFLIGDLKKESFKDIVKSPKRFEYFNNISTHPPCCRDGTNEYLNKMLKNIPFDINFIQRYTSSTSLEKTF